MKATNTGIKRILKAFTYSYKGFTSTFKSEAAFRQDLVVFAVGILLVFAISFTAIERVLLMSSLFLILLMELVNTAVEVVIDRISDEYHELSGKAKDIGSLLVLISFINAGITWVFVLYSHFFGTKVDMVQQLISQAQPFFGK